MDRLRRTHFVEERAGQVGLSHYHLVCLLNKLYYCLKIPCAEEGQ